MKSAFECFLKAAKCEMLAHASADDVEQKALLATAKQWRMLGEQVQAAEDGNLRAAKSGKPL